MVSSSRRVVVLGLAIASGFALVSAATGSWNSVGSPPTISGERCDSFIGPCGDPFVLGTVSTGFDGPVEVVGMSWSGGPCIYFDNIRHRAGAGYCAESALPDPGDMIQASMALRPTRRSTEITGEISADVRRVTVAFRRNGARFRRSAQIVRVSVELAQRAGEQQPFGLFELAVPGCVPAERFRATAASPDGGRQTIRFRPSHDC